MPDPRKDLWKAISTNEETKDLFIDEAEYNEMFDESPRNVYEVLQPTGFVVDYDDFKNIAGLKKNESLQPSSQPYSEDSQTISKGEGRVSPLGEIKHAPNVDNKPVMVGGQPPVKPKKEIPSIDGKIDIEQKSSSTAAPVKPLNKPVATPTKQAVEQTFKETKERFAEDMAMADYEVAQEELADESKFIQRLESGDLELQEKYFPEGLSQNIEVRRKQIKQLIADHNARMDEKNVAAAKSHLALGETTDKIIEDALKDNKYKDFLTTDVTGAIEIVDNGKIQDLADQIVSDRGISDEGYVRRYLTNKLKTEVEFRSIEKDVNKEFEKLLEPLSDKDYNELVKKAATGDKEAQVQLAYQSKRREIQKGLPTAEQEELKLEIAAKNISKDIEAMASEEIKPLEANYKRVVEEMNSYLDGQKQAIESQLNALGAAYESGQMSREDYESQFNLVQDQFNTLLTAKNDETARAYDEYVRSINTVNTKYQKRYAREVTELQNAAQKRLEVAYGSLSEKMADPSIKDAMNNLYGVSAKRVLDKKQADDKTRQEIASNYTLIGRDLLFAKTTVSAFGNFVKEAGVAMNSEEMEDFGDRVANRFQTYAPKTSNWSDLTDLNNNAVIAGNFLGGTAPSMAVGYGAAVLTGGLGSGAAGQMAASAIAAWITETTSVVGGAKSEAFNRTGDAAAADEAAKKALDSQIDLIWAYGLDGLPFVKNALDFVPTQVGRMGVGGATEFTTELIQEFNQGIAQENISKGLDPWENYIDHLTDVKKIKETAITIIPAFATGGIGQVGSKSKSQVLADSFVAAKTKNALNDVFEDQKGQYFRDLTFNEGVKTAKAVVASLYAGGQISESEMAELNSVVDEAQSFEATAKENGLSFNDRDIYAFYASRANAAERRATETDDEILSSLYQQQAKDYRNAAVNFLKGEEPDFYSIKYKDGSQFLFSPQDAREAFKSDKLKDALENNEVEIAAFSEEGAKSLNALMADVKARKENKEAVKQEVARNVLEQDGGLNIEQNEDVKEEENIDIKTKQSETEAKIKRKDLFRDGGSFSNQLGGSGVDSVPTRHREVDGIEFVEFSNPNTGDVDVIMTGTSDTDYVGYYRIYENGKPTNKWSSKFENQSRNKENFKTMISGAQEMLPVGHEYTEKTSISTDGLRVWGQQLSRGYQLQYDENGNVVTNTVAINGDAIVNELGIDVDAGSFSNISVTTQEQFEKVKKALLPYLAKFGLSNKNIHWVNGTVEIDLPVLLNTKKSTTSSENKSKPTEEQPVQETESQVAEVKVGDKVTLPPRIANGQERTMVFTDQGWKQQVGDQVTEVNEATQKQAQEAFNLTAPKIEVSEKTESEESQKYESIKNSLPDSDYSDKESFEKDLKDGSWAFLTAENPDNKKYSEEENKKRNKEAEKWLESKGYKPQKVAGKYDRAENSYYVKGMSKSDAIAFANIFGQESVATNEGLYYQDGSFQKRVKGEERFGSADNYVSAIKIGGENVEFSIKYEDAKNTPQKAQEKVAGNKLFSKPLEDAFKVAVDYMKSIGKKKVTFKKVTNQNFNKDYAREIAKAFEEMKNDPSNKLVREAYEAMAKETMDQYNAIVEKGYSPEINNTEPYSSSEEMIADLRDNKRMKIFSTESGFGDTPITDQQRAENPLLRDSGVKDINGVPLLINDVFRFVHDFFGHAELGNGFGAVGEENAWRVHAGMYSPLARRAMTTETRGQNSWVNFSGVNDEAFSLRDKARALRGLGELEAAGIITEEVYGKMKFADQKIGLLPEEFSEISDSEIQSEESPTSEKTETPKDLEGKEAAKAKVDAVAARIKEALKAKGIEGIEVQKHGFSSEEIIDMVANGVKSMIDVGYAVKDAIDYMIEQVKDIVGDDADSIRDRVETMYANQVTEVFTAIEDAKRSKKIMSNKKQEARKAAEKYGEVGKKAIFVDENFEDIVQSLLKDKKITRVCP